MSVPGSNNQRIETDEFMLTLRNIKRSNGIIYAEYEPENSNTTGNISIRISDKEVISTEASEYDKDFPIYLNHAIKALKTLANEEKLPEEKMLCGIEGAYNATPFRLYIALCNQLLYT